MLINTVVINTHDIIVYHQSYFSNCQKETIPHSETLINVSYLGPPSPLVFSTVRPVVSIR